MNEIRASASDENRNVSQSMCHSPSRMFTDIRESSISEGEPPQLESDISANSPLDRPFSSSGVLPSIENSPHLAETTSLLSTENPRERDLIEDHSDTISDSTSLSTVNGYQDTAHNEPNNLYGKDSQPTELWTPWSLRSKFLLGNCLLFAIFIVLLEVLYGISQRHHGLAQSKENMHYLWTYGPTAILTLFAALWGQVEYRTKQLLPWKNLHTGPSKAANNLQLDYVSSWEPMALYSALKSMHHAVYAAVVGSMLIKIIIVASTGLIVLQDETLTTSNAELKLTDRFSLDSLTSVDSRPAVAAIGIQLLDLPYISGTSSSYAVQSFTSLFPHKDRNYVLSATVDAFFADLECEILTVSNHSTTPIDYSNSRNLCPVEVFTFSTPICNGGATSSSFDYQAWQEYQNQSGGLFRVNCPAAPSEPDADRLLLITSSTQLRGNQSAVFTALSCKPTYSINKALVRIDQSGILESTTLDPEKSLPTSHSANISAWDIAMGAMKSADLASLGAASDQLATTSSQPPRMYCTNEWQDKNSTTLLSLAISAAPGLDITDASKLQTAIQRSYKIITAQLAKQSLMVPTDETLTGTQTFTTQRIVVRELSLRIMEAALAVLIIMAIVVLLFRPSRSSPEDMSTIGRLALVMAQSPSFVEVMRGLGSTNMRRIDTFLSERSFRTVITKGNLAPSKFSIEPVVNGILSVELTTEKPKEMIDWWRPLPIRLVSRCGILLLTAFIVIALEVLLNFSQKNNGLVAVNTSDYEHYGWTYTPGAVMVSLQLLYGVVDFSTRVVQPYIQLKRTPSSAERSILINYLSHLTIVTAWKSAFNRHFMVLCTATTMLLAPFLTIVASGLFTAVAVPYNQPAAILTRSVINSTGQRSYLDTSATLKGNITITTSLILGSNMSYPMWTHENLVFPSLSAYISETNAVSSDDTANATTLTARVPTLYTSLNCTRANADQVRLFVESITVPEGEPEVYRIIALPVPSSCGNKCLQYTSESEEKCTDGSYDFAIMNNNGQHHPINGSFFGKVFEVDTIRSGCPSLIAVYGKNNEDTTKIEDMVVTNCYPFTAQAEVDTVFSLPNWTAIATTIDLKTQKKLDRNAVYPFYAYLPANTVSGYDYDPAFAALAFGRDGIPVHQLLGPDNASKVMDALERLYGRWSAQALNIIGRIPAPSDTAALNGTFMFGNQMRLQQSVISTRTLEVLLLLMLICMVITLLQIDTKELLPINPCSIGAMAALIAESEMVKQDNLLSAGLEWHNDRQLKRMGIFEGLRFSLGWWNKTGSNKQRYGIDIQNLD